MSIVEQTYVEQTRPARVDALMWIAERADLLADGYAVSARSTFDEKVGTVGHVTVQGDAGSLRSLVALFSATPAVEPETSGYRHWRVLDEGVLVEFVEERA